MDSIPFDICPISYWKKRRPNALACGPYTYEQFDAFVDRVAESLPSDEVLSFYPEKTPEDIAYLFAAWRQKKAVYPINVCSKHISREKLKETGFATYIETSSASKIVCHNLLSHQVSAMGAIDVLELTQNDKYCLNLPLFHVAGIATCMRTFMAGAHLTFDENESTHISMVPTQLYRMLEENRRLPHLKCLLLGGAPLSETLKQKASHLPIIHSYGMTETASMVIYQKLKEPVRAIDHTKVKLSSSGEILLQGATLFHHYVGKPPQTGWFATRDLADENLNIIGRKDRQFISGGENIQPEEIEKELLKLSGVIEAKVEPLESEEWGMRPGARVLAARHLSEEALKAALMQALPKFKVPEQIEVHTASEEWGSKSQLLSK